MSSRDVYLPDRHPDPISCFNPFHAILSRPLFSRSLFYRDREKGGKDMLTRTFVSRIRGST